MPIGLMIKVLQRFLVNKFYICIANYHCFESYPFLNSDILPFVWLQLTDIAFEQQRLAAELWNCHRVSMDNLPGNVINCTQTAQQAAVLGNVFGSKI